MSKLSKFVRGIGKNDPPRPKWRDEQAILRMVAFPMGFAVAMLFFQNNKTYSWAEMALYMTVAFLWGNLVGHSSGVETERLFPSGYRWDGETKKWIKKEEVQPQGE